MTNEEHKNHLRAEIQKVMDQCIRITARQDRARAERVELGRKLESQHAVEWELGREVKMGQDRIAVILKTLSTLLDVDPNAEADLPVSAHPVFGAVMEAVRRGRRSIAIAVTGIPELEPIRQALLPHLPITDDATLQASPLYWESGEGVLRFKCGGEMESHK